MDYRTRLKGLCKQLAGTLAERLDDPELITNRAAAYYGEGEGLAVVLDLIDQHLKAPQVRESDGSAHTEAFVPGVGPVQLSTWPRDYFVPGEDAYIAIGFASQ